MSALWIFLLLWAGLSPPLAQEARTHVEFQSVSVKPGDTLWSISNAYLKDPARWDEILKFNKLPSSDPTVALPGMTLRIPIRLIKEELMAARLVSRVNEVVLRRKDTVAWDQTQDQMQLYRGDSLRTLRDARARVQFLDRDLFILNPNSLAVIRPPNQQKYDIELQAGGISAGNKRVSTLGAEIIPMSKDTKFTATVREDKSTVVEVYKGKADVLAAGKRVSVAAGKATEVSLGLAPSAPVNIPDLPDFEARAAQLDESTRLLRAQTIKAPGIGTPPQREMRVAGVEELFSDFKQMMIGTPVSGYRIQISASEDFSNPLLDKVVEVDERFTVKDLGLSRGTYWCRIALIDLLGSEGRFSRPKKYQVQ